MIAGAVTGKSKLEEYLALEEASEERYEFLGGRIYAMGGASFPHGQISGSVTGAFRHALEPRGCTAIQSDLRVRLESSTSFVYPDVTVVCGDPIYPDDDPMSVTNPLIVVEVLSPSTGFKDFAVKLPKYKALPTLQAILFVHQDEPKIHYFFRKDDLWDESIVEGLTEKLIIKEPEMTLDLEVVYKGIRFSSADSKDEN